MKPLKKTARKKILFIDDSRPLLEEIREILEEEGYEVFTAHDPYVAMSEVVQLGPDLIITDIEMPLVNGYEIISFFRSIEHLKTVPILILSSQSSPPEISKALMVADIFLKKPCSIDDLVAAVSLLLSSADRKSSSIDSF